MKKLFLLLTLFLFAAAGRAQSTADSIRFFDPSGWETLRQDSGLSIRKFTSKAKKESTHLFDAPQAIYIMEIDPAQFRIEPVQEEKRRTAGKLGRDHEAVAAVNGGFFVVHPEPKDAAVANDFLKINGRVCSPYPTLGWGDAAVGFDNNSRTAYTYWNKAMDSDTVTGWSAAFPNVMVAGPMLIRDGNIVHGWSDVNKATLDSKTQYNMYAPRTTIGTKADGTIVLVVTDGRRRRAYGSSFAELAAIGRWLGLTDMLNLDGGGSTTLWHNKTGLVNFPSDGQGILPLSRDVANALLVFPRNTE